MRLTRQAALAIALIAGLLAALLAWVVIGKQNKPKPKEVEMVSVPVPSQTIPAGTELQATMFQAVQQPKDQLTTNIVTDAQTLEGRIAITELPQNQPVRAELVQERSARLGMAYALNPGLRALAVSLDVIGTVGDFIKPLDHVDVLTALRQDNQVVVRTLVQDVVVLAIGQTVSAAPPTQTEEETSETKKEAPPPRKTETPVTLALTPAQSQIILTADQAGDLRLTLRARNDNSVVPLPVANSWTMIGPVPKAAGGSRGPEGGPPSATTATPGGSLQPVGGLPRPGDGPTLGGVGTAGATQPSGPQRPKKPFVEVVRGGATEYVVPE